MAHEFTKEFNEQFRFWVISCPEGCMITRWNEGDDILDYSAFEVAYCPENADITAYHCISVEDHEMLMAEQMNKINEEERKNEN